jgi:hypothetical protein
MGALPPVFSIAAGSLPGLSCERKHLKLTVLLWLMPTWNHVLRMYRDHRKPIYSHAARE